MITALLIIHLVVTLALIGVVLIQRSEGGGLGIGTSQGMGSFMSGRGTANLLTRTTAILATAFLMLSLILALLNRGTSGVGHDILDTPPTRQAAPSGLPVPPTPGAAPGTLVGGAPVAPPVASPGAPPVAPPGAAAPAAQPAAPQVPTR